MLTMTGSTGFIGSFLKKWLNCPIIELTRQQIKEKKDFSGCNALIHLACSSNPRHTDFTTDLEQNLVSTIALFETFAKSNPQGHIVYASTGGNMYCDQTGNFPKTEEDPPLPRSGYGIHKLAAEHYLRLIAASFGLSATILRISNPYGVLLPKNRSQGLIGVAFSKLLSDEPVTILDPRESLRDYIHLEDVAKCFDKVLKNPPGKGLTNIYHVSSGKGYTIFEVLSAIEELMGRKFKMEYAPESFTKKPSISILSYEKLKKELDWQPEISFLDGLKRMKEQIYLFGNLNC